MTETGIGAPVRRTEDKRFLTGRGNYLDDINVAGQTYAYFARSPHAHAKINGIDKDSALSMPGVVAVLTGADWVDAGLGLLGCAWMIHSKDGSEMKQPVRTPLATASVQFVGEPVAAIIAETADQARDAAEALAVDYQPLPSVTDLRAAVGPEAPQLHECAPGNLCYEWEIGDQAATDAAFEAADRVVSIDLVNNRLVPNPIEPRAALARFDPATDEITLYTTSQAPHVVRLVMAAFLNIAPEHKLRVISPDVGGGFGVKIATYPEEAVCTWACRKIGRPIKWTADRSQAFLGDSHGRDHVSHAELALDKDGIFLGMRVKTLANLGGYLAAFGSAVPSYMYATLLAGQYRTPAIYAEVDAVFTNTSPVDAYRGAGRPEASYLVERLVEVAAREIGMDPAELRRKNFIAPDAFPFETPVGVAYDSGNYEGSLGRVLEMADQAGFEKRREEAKGRGKLRGFGISAYIEACGVAPSQIVGALGAGVGLYESAEIRFNATGSVTVFTGCHSHGQGLETTYAQIVSDRLGVPLENIDVVFGDTGRVQMGMGTYGSRSLAVGGSALVKAADKIIAKCSKIAAHILEAAEEDLEYESGKFTVAGTDRGITVPELAFAAYVPHNYPLDELEPGLDETAFYDPVDYTFPAGTHVCEVEVDPETGQVEIVNFVAVDDFGKVVNPMIVAGQVHGGIVQGLGQAMLEECRYDAESGQLVSGSFMDYAMPRADDTPSFEVELQETPCPHNPLGVKGCGEAGAIAAPAAIINAITDAIGVRHLDMPATPQKVWAAIRDADAQAAE